MARMTQYPPRDFAAYGILAFKAHSNNSPESQQRFYNFCRAYLTLTHAQNLKHVSTLTHKSEIIEIPTSEQMATVWPVINDRIASDLNARNFRNADEICSVAIKNYDFIMSQQAIKQARAAGAKLDGKGPFLLAWSPSYKKGQTDAIILYRDLSDTYLKEQAQEDLDRWAINIEEDPAFWKNGFTIEGMRIKFQKLLDSAGKPLIDAAIDITTRINRSW